MHWIDDRRREKVSRHRSQDIVALYDWSHFVAKQEASLAMPPPPLPSIADKTSGVNEECSISLKVPDVLLCNLETLF